MANNVRRNRHAGGGGIGALSVHGWMTAVLVACCSAGGHAEVTARSEGAVRGLPLQEAVEIERDPFGVPVLRGESYADVVFAQGFLHAQERFFQMDLSRRLAAGTLSELAGALTLASDRRYRVYQFLHLADRVLESLPDVLRNLLERYADGVNAGLDDLEVAPPEYGLLGAAPERWKPRDTILVQCSFAIGLGGSNELERHRGTAAGTLPGALYDFLMDDTRRFEAPMLFADDIPPARPVPGPEVIDLRERHASVGAPADVNAHAQMPESAAWELTAPAALSNNWAVAGWRTAHGGAILAGDPHLQLSLPNTWYRMHLRWDEGNAIGASLPGTPGILFGSNGFVAFAFTNASVDVQDYVIVEVKPGDRSQYRSATGVWRRVDVITDRIEVRGRAPAEIEIRRTEFGPLIGEDAWGRPLAHRWTAADPALVNLDVLRLIDARNVDEAIAIGAAWNGPPQNLVVADAQGRIGWVVTGWLPNRVGMDGTIPVQWSRDVGWMGALPEDLRPMVVDPPSGIVFTANNRTVGGEHGDRLGRQYQLGVRAQRIEKILSGDDMVDELAMLELQLDTHLALMEPYRRIVLGALRDAGGDPQLALMREEVRAWDGTADERARGLVALDAFRRDVHRTIRNALMDDCRRRDPGFQSDAVAGEASILAILEQRPDHLIPPEYDSWSAVFRASLERVAAQLVTEDRRGARIPLWGEARRLRMAHPMAMIGAGPLPLPDEPISGHAHAVRVVTPNFGATLRIAVSPGRETQGIFHMPGGQSGLWTSPHFADGHAAWLEGRPTPLLAGPVATRFRLEP